MKLLFISANHHGRGTYVRMMHLGKHLVQLGHDVTLAYTGDNYFRPFFGGENGYKTIGLPSAFNRLNLDNGASPIAVHWLKGYVKREKFELIHGFKYYPVVHSVGLHAQLEHGIPFISDWADFFSIAENRLLFKVPFYREFMRRKELMVRQQADAVTVISRPMQKMLLQNDSIKKDNILYLPGGAPVDQINPMDMHSCRRHIGISEDGFYFGYMGTTLCDELLPFLKAFSHLPDDPKIKLIIMGASPEKMKNILALAGVDTSRVILAGFVPEDDVGDWLGALNVSLLPMLEKEYNYYRWPNKIGYYMAAACPVIASSVGEVPSVFDKGDIGWLVDNSEEQIHQAMLEAVDKPYLYIEKGLFARHIAETSYSWQSLAKELSNFYSQITTKKERSYAKA